MGIREAGSSRSAAGRGSESIRDNYEDNCRFARPLEPYCYDMDLDHGFQYSGCSLKPKPTPNIVNNANDELDSRNSMAMEIVTETTSGRRGEVQKHSKGALERELKDGLKQELKVELMKELVEEIKKELKAMCSSQGEGRYEM